MCGAEKCGENSRQEREDRKTPPPHANQTPRGLKAKPGTTQRLRVWGIIVTASIEHNYTRHSTTKQHCRCLACTSPDDCTFAQNLQKIKSNRQEQKHRHLFFKVSLRFRTCARRTTICCISILFRRRAPLVCSSISLGTSLTSPTMMHAPTFSVPPPIAMSHRFTSSTRSGLDRSIPSSGTNARKCAGASPSPSETFDFVACSIRENDQADASTLYRDFGSGDGGGVLGDEFTRIASVAGIVSARIERARTGSSSSTAAVNVCRRHTCATAGSPVHRVSRNIVSRNIIEQNPFLLSLTYVEIAARGSLKSPHSPLPSWLRQAC
jgi:hypothetical protein